MEGGDRVYNPNTVTVDVDPNVFWLYRFIIKGVFLYSFMDSQLKLFSLKVGVGLVA